LVACERTTNHLPQNAAYLPRQSLYARQRRT
jgi:hypothetical protein